MINRISYFLELLLLVPLFPFLAYKGNAVRKRVMKLPARSEFLQIEAEETNASSLLVVGESTATGVGASGERTTFAWHLVSMLHQKHHVYNLGKNGLVAARLPRLLTHAKPELPATFQYAVVLIGANDCFKFTPPWKFQKELEKFIKILVKGKSVKKIVIPLIPPVQQFPAIPKIMGVFLGWHRRILTKELNAIDHRHPEVSFIDLSREFPAGFFAEDGIHPSDLGYHQMATEIAKKINTL